MQNSLCSGSAMTVQEWPCSSWSAVRVAPRARRRAISFSRSSVVTRSTCTRFFAVLGSGTRWNPHPLWASDTRSNHRSICPPAQPAADLRPSLEPNMATAESNATRRPPDKRLLGQPRSLRSARPQPMGWPGGGMGRQLAAGHRRSRRCGPAVRTVRPQGLASSVERVRSAPEPDPARHPSRGLRRLLLGARPGRDRHRRHVQHAATVAGGVARPGAPRDVEHVPAKTSSVSWAASCIRRCKPKW
jgi:hypothetical protein